MLPSYEDMLEEAYSNLAEKANIITKDRIEIPLPKIDYLKKWTIIENAKEILDILNRDPSIFIKYLQKEYNVSSKMEENKIIIMKKISFESVNEKLSKFIREFVQCPVCKKLDTILVKKERILFIRCLVCGAESPVLYKL